MHPYRAHHQRRAHVTRLQRPAQRTQQRAEAPAVRAAAAQGHVGGVDVPVRDARRVQMRQRAPDLQNALPRFLRRHDHFMTETPLYFKLATH